MITKEQRIADHAERMAPVARRIERRSETVPVPLRAKRIVEAVAEFYGYKTKDILSERRFSNVCRARHVASYLLREHLNLPHTVVAAATGRRDHSTSLSAAKKIADEIETDADLREEIREILAGMNTVETGPEGAD